MPHPATSRQSAKRRDVAGAGAPRCGCARAAATSPLGCRRSRGSPPRRSLPRRASQRGRRTGPESPPGLRHRPPPIRRFATGSVTMSTNSTPNRSPRYRSPGSLSGRPCNSPRCRTSYLLQSAVVHDSPAASARSSPIHSERRKASKSAICREVRCEVLPRRSPWFPSVITASRSA